MHGRVKTGLVIGALALLAACGGGETADEPVAGGGEVLEGTASDTMLPLATVTSQPPLAPQEPDSSARASAAAPTGGASPAVESTPVTEAAAEPPAPSDVVTPD